MALPARSGINVIVPTAGASEDFQRAGYRFPKPLVNILGRPLLCWVLDKLKLQPDDTVFVAVQRQMELEHAISRRLHDENPGIAIRVVIMDFKTHGPAETLFAVLQHLAPQELERPTISIDSDILFFADILSQFRALPPGISATWYFEDEGDRAVYSYINFVEDSLPGSQAPPGPEPAELPHGQAAEARVAGWRRVLDVREKVAISNHANVGAYGFASGAPLKQRCEEVVDASLAPRDHGEASHTASPVRQKSYDSDDAKLPDVDLGGWYISGVMRGMLQHGATIIGIKLQSDLDFVTLKTPSLLHDFLRKLQKGDSRMHGRRQMRFVFGLDGTLVTPPKRHGDFKSVEPIAQNIGLVRSLKAAGHYVIIWTDREAERLGGNVGAIIAAVGQVTLETLQELKIPYDELIFGKPAADAYIDHQAVNSRVDTEKELGWAAEEKTAGGIDGGIAARAFNTVRPLDNTHVVKTGPIHVMRGELHWYRSIPAELSHLFPQAVEMSDTGAYMASICMTKMNGVPFTHLLVNLCLTPARLSCMLTALTRIHRCGSARSDRASPAGRDGVATCAAPDHLLLPDAVWYANLRPKVADRYTKHMAMYRSFSVAEVGFKVDDAAQTILDSLEKYESQQRACKAMYIHGDPVFSNVLLTASDGGVCFLDMRGAQGDTLTTAGDVTYDLAKVYQSLCGYDFFLEDRVLSPEAHGQLELLQRVFWSHVRQHYPDILPADVRLLTASHFFTIVPLHEVRSRMSMYLRACRNLLRHDDPPR